MIEQLRKTLKAKYDAFVKKYGQLNSSRVRNIIDKDSYGFLIRASLEKRLDGNYVEADVLTKDPNETIEQFRTDDVHEALGYVLGMVGRVDMKLLYTITDLEEEQIVAALGDSILWNPMEECWEESSKLLSGNVWDKLCKVEQYLPEGNSEVERTYKALKEVQPEPIIWPLLQEHINCGERWVPIEFYIRFINHLFESGTDCNIKYFPSVDEYKVECPRSYMHHKITREYYVRSKGNVTMNGMQLFEAAIHNTTPYFTYKDYITAQNVADNDAIQLANEKIENIRSEFTNWLYTLPEEDKQLLVDTYNHLYNCYRLRKYDGSHLKLPGMDLSKLGKGGTPITLYPPQKDVIWRNIQQMGGIIDWEVGGGKTLVQVIASYEMKRMGLRNKPCILCLKANVNDVVTTYRKAYPSAKVLAPTEKDFEPTNRKRLFHEMKNNDWTCVIMTHDQFGKIPQSGQIQMETLQEEIDNLTRDLEVVNGSSYDIRKSLLKGLEHRKASLGVKLQGIKKKIADKKDDDITFEEMGIDHLFVDESHFMKNLQYTTRHNRVAGLGNQEGSQRSLNMLFAIRTLQKRFNADLQATFLTGTPISNSLTEMYLLFKYLRPRELAKQNIINFDGWAAVYAKKTTDFEFSVTNQIIAKERFRHFIKVPELALFYNEIADYRTKKMMNIEEPELVEELVALKRTPDQDEYIHKLIKFAETGDGAWIDRPPLNDAEKAAKMLLATNYAKKMSTDMRLIDQMKYEDHPDSKISVACIRIAEIYYRTKEHRGTQMVFCDLGTPTKDVIVIDKEDNITIPRFTVYAEVRKKLVEEYGLPEEEVQFIHDWEGEKKKIELFRKMNNGDIRVLIGSTSKAGTGLNVQERIVAMHHLDIPWKPAELTQRNGRGARPGNWLAKEIQDNKVYNYVYAVERSLDNYKFTLLKNKQTFISQMKTNELQVRSIDEGSIDEQSGMNYAEYIAILSGDDSLLQKAKLDKKIAVLENLRTVHYREQHNNKYLLEHKKERLEYVTEGVNYLRRDWELYEQNVERDETGTRLNKIHIPELQQKLVEVESQQIRYQMVVQENQLMKSLKLPYTRKADIPEPKDESTVIGEYIIEQYTHWRPQAGQRSAQLGTIYGFNCYIEREEAGSKIEIGQDTGYAAQGTNLVARNKLYVEHPEGGGYKYSYNHGIPSRQNDKIAARQYLLSLNRIESLYAQYSKEKEELERDIQQISSIQEKPFGRQEELDNMKSEQKQLIRNIDQKIKAGSIAVEKVEVE